MNRIAGIYNFDGRHVDSDEIQGMLHAMDFEDQDAQRIWTEGGVGFGCIRAGNGPMERGSRLLSRSANQQCLIAFDGRIDNRPELLAALGARLEAGGLGTSAEALVLAAYERWGLACPGHLIGDFAFAIWDVKDHRLVCARDHFGVKPFYYYLSDKCFVFASALGALLASGVVPPVLYEERIADFLTGMLEGIDKTSTFYQDVYRLPPAHTLVVQAGGVALHRYWELSPTTVPGSESDTIEAFRELLSEAVRCRFQDSVLPASMLSGGMDSSAIVALGRNILVDGGKPPLHAFAFVSNTPEINRESAHISSVLAQGGLQAHLISESELIKRMDELVNAIEVEAEPFDCLMNLIRAVYLHAQDCGLYTLLDGVDGDVLLSDSGYLVPLWRQGAFRAIITETLNADGLIAEYKLGKSLFLYSFLSTFTPLAPDWFRALRRPVRYNKALRSAVRTTILDLDFAIHTHLDERFARLDSHNPRLHISNQVESHKILVEQPFITVALERYSRVASAFGIEPRHPFFDVRLAEFCLGLPWQSKTYHGCTKLILRRALEPYLPPEVVWRADKDSLRWEVNRLILKARGEYFYQITRDESENLKPYVDLRKLMGFWDDYLTHGDETQAESLWSGVALAMWLRQQRKIMKESQK